MQKNVAGQKIGAQMVSATDGSAFTGTVTVYVTLDAGTQGIGTVGSGICTHEGNGYHTYAPSQAETNGTLAAFTFIGTGAVPATVQVFTLGYDPTAAQIPANVTQFGGSNGTFSAGRPEVNTTHAAGTAWNSGAIGAATLAADTITAAKVAADVSNEIADQVWDEALSGHTTAGSAGKQLQDISTGSAPSAATVAAAVWNEALAGHSTAGTSGKKLTDIPTTSAPSAASVADAVWDEAIAGHLSTGTTGEALNTASSGSDPDAIADAVLTRESSNWEATVKAGPLCLGAAVMKATHKTRDNAGTLEVADSTGDYAGTNALSAAITTDAANAPIDEIGALS